MADFNSTERAESVQLLRCPRIPRGLGVVYFFGNSKRRIKIGHTTNPEVRLRTLRYQFGLPCQGFLATVPGGQDLEASYHERFDEHRLGRQEWFSPHPDILAEIERLNQTPVFAIDVSEAAHV